MPPYATQQRLSTDIYTSKNGGSCTVGTFAETTLASWKCNATENVTLHKTIAC